MPKGRENVYECRACGRHLVTIDRDEGTTPMFMRCLPERTPGGCGEMMASHGYPTPPRPAHIAAPTHEWYKPTDEELLAECRGDPTHAPWIRDHVQRGGLLIRPIRTPGLET